MRQTLKLYWVRLWSATPTWARKLRSLCYKIAASTGAIMAFMLLNGMSGKPLFTVLSYIGAIMAGAIPMLSEATADKNLINKTAENIDEYKIPTPANVPEPIKTK